MKYFIFKGITKESDVCFSFENNPFGTLPQTDKLVNKDTLLNQITLAIALDIKNKENRVDNGGRIHVIINNANIENNSCDCVYFYRGRSFHIPNLSFSKKTSIVHISDIKSEEEASRRSFSLSAQTSAAINKYKEDKFISYLSTHDYEKFDKFNKQIEILRQNTSIEINKLSMIALRLQNLTFECNGLQTNDRKEIMTLVTEINEAIELYAKTIGRLNSIIKQIDSMQAIIDQQIDLVLQGKVPGQIQIPDVPDFKNEIREIQSFIQSQSNREQYFSDKVTSLRQNIESGNGARSTNDNDKLSLGVANNHYERPKRKIGISKERTSLDNGDGYEKKFITNESQTVTASQGKIDSGKELQEVLLVIETYIRNHTWVKPQLNTRLTSKMNAILKSSASINKDTTKYMPEHVARQLLEIEKFKKINRATEESASIVLSRVIEICEEARNKFKVKDVDRSEDTISYYNKFEHLKLLLTSAENEDYYGVLVNKINDTFRTDKNTLDHSNETQPQYKLGKS